MIIDGHKYKFAYANAQFEMHPRVNDKGEVIEWTIGSFYIESILWLVHMTTWTPDKSYCCIARETKDNYYEYFEYYDYKSKEATNV